MITFIRKLYAYCIERAEAGLTLEDTIDYDPDSDVWITNSIYDEAISGMIPDIDLRDKLKVLEMIRLLKYYILLSQEDLDTLGESYIQYCDAICICMAYLDLKCLKLYYLNELDYDFYQFCCQEGIVYNRFHYVTMISSDLQLHIMSKLETSGLLDFIAKEIKKSRQIDKMKGNALVVDGETILSIPEYTIIEDDKKKNILREYDKLIKHNVFRAEILSKLPEEISAALIAKSNKCNKTLLAFCVQAIISEYGKQIGEVTLTDSLFEVALGIKVNTFNKYRDKKMRDIIINYNSYEEYKDLKELLDVFPKYRKVIDKSFKKNIV